MMFSSNERNKAANQNMSARIRRSINFPRMRFAVGSDHRNVSTRYLLGVGYDARYLLGVCVGIHNMMWLDNWQAHKLKGCHAGSIGAVFAGRL